MNAPVANWRTTTMPDRPTITIDGVELALPDGTRIMPNLPRCAKGYGLSVSLRWHDTPGGVDVGCHVIEAIRFVAVGAMWWQEHQGNDLDCIKERRQWDILFGRLLRAHERRKGTMLDPILADDICRCHDSGCPERERCLRWLHRGKAHGEHVSHCGSLFPFDLDIGKPCPMRIAPEDGRALACNEQ